MIYLDNAATSWPKPESVYRAMDDFARNHAANPGKGGHRMSRASAERVQEARSALARLLGTRPEQVVLTLNATDALNIAIKGFLSDGDHVVTSVMEHFSVSRSLAALERAGRIRVTRVMPEPDGRISPGAVKSAVTSRTRLIAVVHASNVLGTLNPVEEYRSGSALLLVDAAQTAGLVAIHPDAADLIAMTGHKNLFGPMGTGALYVREGVNLRAWREGASGPSPDQETQPEEMPDRLEAGTPNAPGLAGLAAGLGFIEKTGRESILLHKRDLAERFREGIAGRPRVRIHGRNDLGTVSVTIEGVDPKEAGRHLDEEYGIACRPGTHCAPGVHRFLGTLPGGTIRFSFGIFNTPQHADVAAEAVRRIAGGKA